MRKASLQSREGGVSRPSARRASTERNPCSPPAAWIPMRGAGGPQTFDGVLPGSENRAARDRALPQIFDVRRGAPARSSRSAHRLPTNPIAPAREAVAKEEKK
jgi:hypothetical protein